MVQRTRLLFALFLAFLEVVLGLNLGSEAYHRFIISQLFISKRLSPRIQDRLLDLLFEQVGSEALGQDVEC